MNREDLFRNEATLSRLLYILLVVTLTKETTDIGNVGELITTFDSWIMENNH